MRIYNNIKGEFLWGLFYVSCANDEALSQFRDSRPLRKCVSFKKTRGLHVEEIQLTVGCVLLLDQLLQRTRYSVQRHQRLLIQSLRARPRFIFRNLQQDYAVTAVSHKESCSVLTSTLPGLYVGNASFSDFLHQFYSDGIDGYDGIGGVEDLFQCIHVRFGGCR